MSSGDNLLLSQVETASMADMMPGGGPPANMPEPCSAAGHLNSPVINIVDKSSKTEHSHSFIAPDKGEMMKAVLDGLKQASNPHHGTKHQHHGSSHHHVNNGDTNIHSSHHHQNHKH